MLPVSDRVAALRQQVLDTMPTLRADRSLLAREALQQYHDAPPILQRAQMLAHVLRHIPIGILEGELIVGLPSDTLNAAQVFFPENSPAQLMAELDTLSTREQDRFFVSDETKAAVSDLAAYWQGHTANDRITAMLSAKEQAMLNAGLFFIQKDVGYGHCLADYETLLKIGFSGFRRRAQDALDAGTGTTEQQQFWQGICIVCDAAIAYALRYAALAETLATVEADSRRKAELFHLADICRKVPCHPAESFHEALQSLWFAHLIIQIESDGTGVSFGRLDQYLLPYYENSLASGLPQEALQELLDCFWIKTNHLLKFRPIAAAKLWSGYIMNQNVTIAGVDADGRDATNALSYMCLECQRRLCLKEPQFSLRVAENTPTSLLTLAAEVLSTGGGKPQFVSDPTLIRSLLRLGLPQAEAQNFAIIGCVEPGIVGGWGRCKGGHLNLPKILEVLLFHGTDPITQTACAKASAHDPENFDAFFSAFAETLHDVIGTLVGIQKNITHRVLEEDVPHIYLSALFPDCIGRGADFTRGGARHDWSSFTVTGLANVIDSLYTIKTLVYDRATLSLDALRTALQADFKGYASLLDTIRRLPKYGNDIEEVDSIGARLANLLYDTAEQFRAHRDSRVTLGYVTVTKSVSYGRRTGATPDGRHAFEPFADGISPSHTCDIKGPTAVMLSTRHLDLVRAGEGCILNQKFMPSALKEPYQRETFAAFVKTYLLDLSGLHVQFNIVDRETLLAAQRDPAAYKNLLVRVSGFSAYFTELSKEVQEDVIGRTEFSGL